MTNLLKIAAHWCSVVQSGCFEPIKWAKNSTQNNISLAADTRSDVKGRDQFVVSTTLHTVVYVSAHMIHKAKMKETTTLGTILKDVLSVHSLCSSHSIKRSIIAFGRTLCKLPWNISDTIKPYQYDDKPITYIVKMKIILLWLMPKE